jgi:hypothetical protein
MDQSALVQGFTLLAASQLLRSIEQIQSLNLPSDCPLLDHHVFPQKTLPAEYIFTSSPA